MALSLFERNEEKRAVLVQWTAQSRAVLGPGKGRVGDRSKGVARLKAPVPEETKNVAAKVIRSALGYYVDDSARRTSKLRRERISDYLKLLDCFLADGGTRSIDRIVGVIGAVNLDQIGTTALAPKIQARGWRRSNRTSVVAAD